MSLTMIKRRVHTEYFVTSSVILMILKLVAILKTDLLAQNLIFKAFKVATHSNKVSIR